MCNFYDFSKLWQDKWFLTSVLGNNNYITTSMYWWLKTAMLLAYLPWNIKISTHWGQTVMMPAALYPLTSIDSNFGKFWLGTDILADRLRSQVFAYFILLVYANSQSCFARYNSNGFKTRAAYIIGEHAANKTMTANFKHFWKYVSCSRWMF